MKELGVRISQIIANHCKKKFADTMQYYAEQYGSGFAVDAGASGCLNGRCLHDAVINDRPWDPEDFDVEMDYGLFVEGEHEVQMQYLQVLLSGDVESKAV